MTLGYVKVQNIIEQGGYVITAILGSEYRDFDSNNIIVGKLNELSLIDTFNGAPNPIFILPEITTQGCICGIKNYSRWSDAAVRVEVRAPQSSYLVAGILAQPIDECLFQGNAGESAIFVGEYNADPEIGNTWYLISYNAGSTVAP